MDGRQIVSDFEFDMNFNPVTFGADEFSKPSEGSTKASFFFGDEGIDTTTASFNPSFDLTNTQMYPMPVTEPGFSMQQNLTLDNTLGDAAWNNQLDFAPTPSQSFVTYQPFNSNMKRPLQADTEEFPLSKRHEGADYTSHFASPFLTSASVTGSASWTVDSQTPSSNSADVGLSDDAADVCATWFSKYAMLPNDRHIESLSQLTGESAPAIRCWFGQLMKQGLSGQDSAYKSQTGITQATRSITTTRPPTTQTQMSIVLPASNPATVESPAPRGGKKGCTPTSNPDLLCRDPNKIYQCTRKCGKRYGRKCDWKRNEEEGYPSKSWVCSLCVSQGAEKVKPCFRKYHFSQHFRNIHPGTDSATYEETSLVQSETGFPRKCGFCPRRFASRRDRIDHLAAHFKKGKSMLDWNDDEDDNQASDDDDDDDNEDGSNSDDFQQGNNSSYSQQPENQDQSGPKQNGNGNNGNAGGFGPFDGFGQHQFHSAQSSDQGEHSIPRQGFGQLGQQQQQLSTLQQSSLGISKDPGEKLSVSQSSRYEETAGDDAQTLARDAIPQPLMSTSKPSQSNSELQVMWKSFLSNFELDGLPELISNDHIIKPPDLGSTLQSQTQSQNQALSVLPEDDSEHVSRVNQNAAALALQFKKNPRRLAQFFQAIIDAGSDHTLPLQGALLSPKSLFISDLQQIFEREIQDQQGDKAGGLTKAQSLSNFVADCVIPYFQRNASPEKVLPSITNVHGADQPSPIPQLGDKDVPKSTLDSLIRAGFSRDKQMTLQTQQPSNILAITYTLDDTTQAMLKVEQKSLSPNHVTDGTIATIWRDVAARAEDSYLKSQSFLSVKLLGAGGFSTVDEVVHRETNLRISRKTLKNREQSALEELKKEVEVLQKLRHPHIIRFLGAYSREDKVSILLSPVAETTLAVWLEKSYAENAIGLADTVVKMFGCLASSIRYLHEQRPVVKHMDIKPQNILIMQGDYDIPHVVLSDFGISSSDEENPGLNSKPLTRQYCAPEVPAGLSREKASDIWSLGCVFLEMLFFAFRQDNPQWLDFRREFSGRGGMYYWQEVPRLHEWLSILLGSAASIGEATALRTVKTMLEGMPSNRPSAAMLTMVFTPAPCCLRWPNESASFPGPLEELETVEMLLREEGGTALAEMHVCNGEHHRTDQESFERASSWLDECTQNHEACRRSHSDDVTLPTRLLDLRPDDLGSSSIRLVNSKDIASCSSQVAYVALSHVWSDSDLTLSTARLASMQSYLPLTALSPAINDAIATANGIGSRYIWVDSLCILQDSEEDKRRECVKMASVYRNSMVTIAVGEANDFINTMQVQPPSTASGAMQVSSDPTQLQSVGSLDSLAIKWQSPGFSWDTRAWSLQERLLCGRLLHLTEGQMYWECNALKASETFPQGLPSLVWEKAHTKSASAGSKCPSSAMMARGPMLLRFENDDYRAVARLSSVPLAVQHDFARSKVCNGTLLGAVDVDSAFKVPENPTRPPPASSSTSSSKHNGSKMENSRGRGGNGTVFGNGNPIE